MLKIIAILYIFIFNFFPTGIKAADPVAMTTQSPINIIKEIDSLDQAMEIIDIADEQTLVFFDLDDMLTTPRDLILNPKFHPEFLSRIQDSINLFVHKHKYLSLKLIESISASLIKNLHNKNIHVFGLTAQYSNIENMTFYGNAINNLGVDFTASIKDFDINNFSHEGTIYTQDAKFHKGIIFTNANTKGHVLFSFLKQTNITPRKIIFLDDLSENIEDVKYTIEKINEHSISIKKIDFYGYHYNFINKLTPRLNIQMAKYQIEHYKKTLEWLSDDELQKGYFTLDAKQMFQQDS